MHQLGNQLSDTPYYDYSPKRHVTVEVEKTKRTHPGQFGIVIGCCVEWA